LLGRFDVVFFFGTLYHLRHPLLGLERISAITDELICVESAILNDFSISRGGLSRGYGGEMVMEFYPRDEYGQNHSNWWVPTLSALAHMVGSAGFKGVEAWKLQDDPPSVARCRGFAKGWKKFPGKPSRRIPPIRIVGPDG
jgi:tRNA (mo5U34)-methyltransferase